MALFLGIDTSNYTTSIACYDPSSEFCRNVGRLLPVETGKLGLRQSDAVFAHLKAIPDLCQALGRELTGDISAVGVSAKPRPCTDSYMPCFVAGIAIASAIASFLRVPCYEVSHQEGHLAAVIAATKHYDLLEQKFLAWHLSGGTTELLLVTPSQYGFQIEKVGGTKDISAGQLIDRTGRALTLAFPSGKALDALAQASNCDQYFKPRVTNGYFSLSGVENKVQDLLKSGIASAEIARFALLTVASAVKQASHEAYKRFGNLPIVFSGGVASNSLLREIMQDLSPIFAPPEFSTDNALGCAVLAARTYQGEVRS